ncbi:Gfo/Idh/MocA family protein [Dickeya ananatis]|uniref:Gfo/Idh/MocA family protein n=1 Tax=Dickeya ananatis TaxID=3061286 RepID=UPI00388DC678
MARWLTGEEITELSAFGSVIADPLFSQANDVDTALVTLRTTSGALCQIDNARRAVYGYDDRIEVFGTRGLAESSRITEGSVMRIYDDKVLTEGLPKDPMIRMAPSYQAALYAFVDFVRDTSIPSTSRVPGVLDGLWAQCIAEAATRAWRERRIVTLDEITSCLDSVPM